MARSSRLGLAGSQKLTSDVKQRKQRSQHNSPNPNNSYKTKKKFTGSCTEGNPKNHWSGKNIVTMYISQWNIDKKYLGSFIELTKNHHLTIKFTAEISDTEIFGMT